jgi:hypothetical protein
MASTITTTTQQSSSTISSSTDEAFGTVNYVAWPPRQEQDGKFALVGIRQHLKNGRLSNYHLAGDGLELLQNVHIDIENIKGNQRKTLIAVKQVFEPIAQQLTGAKKTIAMYPLFRSEKEDVVKQSGVKDLTRHVNKERPHAIVHNDYDDSFMKFLHEYPVHKLRDFLVATKRDAETNEDLIQLVNNAKRVIVLQFWVSAQPKDSLIKHHPLALCLPRSVKSTDLISVSLPEYGGVATEGLQVSLVKSTRAKEHEWVYFPNLSRSEALVWVGYDSTAVPLCPPFHTGVLTEHLDNDALPRESLEVRVICFLDDVEKVFLPVSGKNSTSKL